MAPAVRICGQVSIPLYYVGDLVGEFGFSLLGRWPCCGVFERLRIMNANDDNNTKFSFHLLSSVALVEALMSICVDGWEDAHSRYLDIFLCFLADISTGLFHAREVFCFFLFVDLILVPCFHQQRVFQACWTFLTAAGIRHSNAGHHQMHKFKTPHTPPFPSKFLSWY